ncbi:MAG: hypothetical protein ACD_76C00062G0001 [uncultured bacterium]|nr:MAG: hypothetical protein ACD_76C00062G0001 [uncultured bacterium]HBD05721.1 hypothetical protein [Candidatus Uhrbacteria bacterium]
MKKPNTYAPGWVWIILIVIAIAIFLYTSQRRATAPQNTPADEEEVAKVEYGETGIAITAAPKQVPLNSIFGVSWEIVTPSDKIADHTAVHYGTKSVPDSDVGEKIAPKNTAYKKATTDFISGSFPVPALFESNIQTEFEAGQTIYMRAHTIIDGVNVWSTEVEVKVAESEQEPLNLNVK